MEESSSKKTPQINKQSRPKIFLKKREMTNPHIVVIPFPAQGHVNPLMNFSHTLTDHGFKITFVNTDYNHNRIMSSTTMATENEGLKNSQIHMISIPDGLGPEDDRNDLRLLCEGILRTMPSKFEELINHINSSEDKTTCVVADLNMAWAFEVASKKGIRGAALWPASAAVLALLMSVPRLIDDGIIDCDGFPIKNQMIQLLPSMPIMDTEKFAWYSCTGNNTETQKKTLFRYMKRCIKALESADRWLCNTTYELEVGAFSLVPKLLPIGPLIESHKIGNSLGQFWTEDSTCMEWLDQQQPHSVIYIAFGSTIDFNNQIQFQELAHGLELLNRPFLWVMRPGSMPQRSSDAYMETFQGTRGKIVGWAPQQKVLKHPAIACFISHCGWNSTMEGLCNGVPLLCWPFFSDQFVNKSYACDVWKAGLGFEFNEDGIVKSIEIRRKVEQLLDDEDIRMRSLALKEMVMNNIAKGGQSFENFNNFIKWIEE